MQGVLFFSGDCYYSLLISSTINSHLILLVNPLSFVRLCVTCEPSKAIYLGFKANHFYWHFWDKLCIADSQIEDETCRVVFELFKSTLCYVKGVASAIGAESDLMRLNNKVGNSSANA